MKNSWYAANSGPYQGLICDEKTGANIAVVYDKANTDILAAAPELLEACQIAYACLRRPENERDENYVVNLLNSIIAKADGGK